MSENVFSRYAVDESGNDEFPLINVQNFIWSINISGLKEGQNRNIMCGQAIHVFDGFQLDPVKMQQAVQKLYDENDALRTILIQKDGCIFQKVAEDYRYELCVRETSGETAADRLKDALSQADAEIDVPLTVFNAILSRFHFYKIDEDDYLIVIYLSHMIADGISVIVTARKLLNYYKNPDYHSQSAHYSQYRSFEEKLLAKEEGKAHVDYWEEKMDGYHEIVHEMDGTEASGVDTIPLSMMYFDKKKTDQFARSFKTSSFIIFTVAYHYMLSKYYHVRDTATGFAIANRRNASFTNTIGLMAKCIPVRIVIDEKDSFADLIRRVAADSQEDSRHQEFADYGLRLRFKSSLQREGSSFMRMPSEGGKMEFPYLNFNRHLSGMWNFAMVINEIENQWMIAFTAETSVFSKECILKFKEYFQEAMNIMLQDANTKVCDLLEQNQEKDPGEGVSA